jgi:RecB family exonuclease
LETQLGLTRAFVSQTERIVEQRACLAAGRTGSRFYEKSFAIDELGTSATILRWCDFWYYHGWRGAVGNDATPRLRDLAHIDGLARPRVPPGTGQRLNMIAALLTQRRPQIESVELQEPSGEYPLAWRRVLAHLPVKETSAAKSPVAPVGSMLHAWQSAAYAMSAGRPVDPIPWRPDETVCIVRAESRVAASQCLSHRVRLHPLEDRVFVVGGDGISADASFAAMDQPRLGISEASACRPALQLLPLALQLLWDPLNFKAVLQFLTHPVGPIPRMARRLLAEKMSETPGIGGDSWLNVLQKIEARYGAEGAEVLAEVRFWFEGSRFPRSPGAPLESVVECVERIAGFIRARHAEPDPARRPPWLAAHQQILALRQALDSLQRQGLTRVGPDGLGRLMDQAMAAGCDNPLLGPQAAAGHVVRSGSSIVDLFDEVCWWWMSGVPLEQPYPWSPREVEHLRAIGVDLPDLGAELRRETRGWMRPLWAARRRLVLMLPRPGEEVHPAWLMLSSLLASPPIVEVEGVLTGAGTDTSLARVSQRPLPALRRWWQLPAGVLRTGDRPASFTSLQQFLYNPYQWALHYPAALQTSALLEIPDDFQLCGLLAHRIVERLYQQSGSLSWNPDRVRTWLDGAAKEVVREEGAVLLMPGRGADLTGFLSRFARSLIALHQILQRAGAHSVEPEMEARADTPLGTLTGSIDLLVTLQDGRTAIIDMKWSGTRSYQKRIKEQRHIQLAIYARLIERNTSRWPAVAYYMLPESDLLTCDDGVFPGVNAVRAPDMSTAALWEKVSVTWAWRCAQLEAGRLEIVREELDETEESNPPIGALAIEPLNERYNPCARLAGWSTEA